MSDFQFLGLGGLQKEPPEVQIYPIPSGHLSRLVMPFVRVQLRTRVPLTAVGPLAYDRLVGVAFGYVSLIKMVSMCMRGFTVPRK